MNARMPDIAVIVVVYNKLHPQCLPTLRRVIERTKLTALTLMKWAGGEWKLS